MRRRSATAIVSSTFMALALAVAVPQASAQVAPSLQGEALLSGTEAPTGEGFFDATCDGGTMTFFAEGFAAGPYLGTFTESGRLTVDEAGNVTDFEASFTILSADTIITGMKEVTAPIENGSVTANQAFCLETEETVFSGFGSAFTYEATIDSPTLGSFSDSGVGDTIGQEFDLEASGGPVGSTFQEHFRLSNGVVAVGREGHVTGGGWIGDSTTHDHASFGFTARKDEAGAPHGHCTVIDHASDTTIRCLTVDSVVQLGTHATFRGLAEVDGVQEDYRIDVDDLGEPGTLDTFKIETDSYTRAGVLSGGNIQVHRAP